MICYRTLESVDTKVLHRVFTLAFSDYSVQVDMPMDKFMSLLKRNGFAPALSAAAFSGDIPAGFIINGFRIRDGKKTIYDSGTGVIPAYRHQGLTTGMFAFLSEHLKASGVQQYLLEVIQSNLPAYGLYSKLGFGVLRELSCYRAGKAGLVLPVKQDVEFTADMRFLEDAKIPSFWDFRPSWQNSVDSAKSGAGDCIAAIIRLSGEIAGYGIIDQTTGSFYQLAVEKQHRGKGIGAGLLNALIQKSKSDKLSFLNVYSGCDSMCGFLEKHGFRLEVKQYEMIRKLD